MRGPKRGGGAANKHSRGRAAPGLYAAATSRVGPGAGGQRALIYLRSPQPAAQCLASSILVGTALPSSCQEGWEGASPADLPPLNPGLDPPKTHIGLKTTTKKIILRWASEF